LRFKFGLGFIIIGFFMPAFGFAVPFLHLPAAVSTAIVGFFIVGGPEVCLLLGAALAGRDAVNLVKSKLLHSAGKTRYYAGLTLFVTCFGSNMLFAYLELTDVLKVGAHPWLYTMLSLDLAAIFGMVLMGPEFFHKLKRIFVWEGETD